MEQTGSHFKEKEMTPRDKVSSHAAAGRLNFSSRYVTNRIHVPGMLKVIAAFIEQKWRSSSVFTITFYRLAFETANEVFVARKHSHEPLFSTMGALLNHSLRNLHTFALKIHLLSQLRSGKTHLAVCHTITLTVHSAVRTFVKKESLFSSGTPRS